MRADATTRPPGLDWSAAAMAARDALASVFGRDGVAG
jgi:hypothetical protein